MSAAQTKAIRKALEERYKEDFEHVDDVEELVLDGLLELKALSPADKEFLEKFASLKSLSMSSVGLETLENFPALPAIVNVTPQRLS